MLQLRAIGICVALIIVTAVCGRVLFRGDATFVFTSTAAASEVPLTPAPLKIGLPTGKTSFANVDVVVAQAMGLFKQQALDVTIQNFDSGVKVVQAVVASDVAIGGASIEPVINASVAGGNIAIIGTYANRLTVSMVTPKTITSVAELRGKNADIQDVGAFREVMTLMVLESATLTTKDVHYIPVSAPGYIQGLISGQIHSAILQTEQAIEILERDARFHVLVDLHQVEPDYFYGTYFVSADWLAKKPDLAIRFLTALTQAHRLMYQNRADTVSIAAKATGFNAGVIDKAYEVLLVNNKVFPVNDGLEEKRLTYTIAKMKSLGLLKDKAPDLARLVDRRLLVQVLGQLGTLAQSLSVVGRGLMGVVTLSSSRRCATGLCRKCSFVYRSQVVGVIWLLN
jgi:NitT/TauT family transport system substrate-binding protein